MVKHKEPDKSSEKVSPAEFYERTGTVDNLQKRGIVYIPDHDSKQLKKFRDQEFEKAKQIFIDHRNLHKLKTTESDLVQHRTKWLEMELEKIIKWLKDESNLSNEIEIEKYQKIVLDEIDEVKTSTKRKKSFLEYLIHSERKILADKIKKEFTTERGRRIRTGYFSVISELFIRLYGRFEMVGYTIPNKAFSGKEIRSLMLVLVYCSLNI